MLSQTTDDVTTAHVVMSCGHVVCFAAAVNEFVEQDQKIQQKSRSFCTSVFCTFPSTTPQAWERFSDLHFHISSLHIALNEPLCVWQAGRMPKQIVCVFCSLVFFFKTQHEHVEVSFRCVGRCFSVSRQFIFEEEPRWLLLGLLVVMVAGMLIGLLPLGRSGRWLASNWRK